MKLYICNFYSYSDRKLLYYDTIDSYANATMILSGMSFKYNDNINTEQIVNIKPNGNYIILTKDDDTIESRWYIVNLKKLRTNQYNLILKRDVLADYYNSFKDIPMMINRATPLNTSDINIFNSENISFNKIKESEYEIKDETTIPWIVGYVPRNFPETAKKVAIPILAKDTTKVDIEVPSLSSWEYYKYLTTRILVLNRFNLRSNFRFRLNTVDVEVGVINLINGNVDAELNISNTGVNQNTSLIYSQSGGAFVNRAQFLPLFKQFFDSSRYSVISNMLTTHNDLEVNDSNILNAINGKLIKDKSTSKIYLISVESNLVNTLEEDHYSDFTTYLNNSITKTFESMYGSYSTNDDSYHIDINGSSYCIKLEEVAADHLNITIPTSSNRTNLEDQPYDMFCMPFSDIYIYYDEHTFNCNSFKKKYSLKIAQAISEQLGSSSIYDIQILPFCPIREIIRKEFPKQEIYSLNDYTIPYTAITNDAGDTIQKVYWCSNSNFNFKLNIKSTKYLQQDETSIETKGLSLEIPTDVKEFKVANETKSMRLVAPDYSNFFDFNYLMNNGFNQINVECTYMPYQPYIRIYPDFNYLYGSSFNDSRGLILKGDYSIPQLTSAWANYKQNNKNYLNTFNLETQMLTKQNEISKTQDIVGALTGTVSGVVSGAMTGAIAGGPTGAIAGGVVSGVASGVGGIADIFTNQQLRDMQMSSRKKNFNFSLENIQAIPYGLSSSGTFNFNRHLFPFIEFYSASDEEISLFSNWLDYNSMTMHKIDTIFNYSGYIESSILTNAKLDENILREINGELNAGIYKEV